MTVRAQTKLVDTFKQKTLLNRTPMKYEEEEYCSDLLNQIKNLIYKNKSAFEVGTLDFEVLTILLEKKNLICNKQFNFVRKGKSNVDIGTRKSKVEVA